MKTGLIVAFYTEKNHEEGILDPDPSQIAKILVKFRLCENAVG
jgi:hypothetical protein